MPDKYPLAIQTLFAELIEQCMDASFDQDFDARGSFITKSVKGKDYLYFQQWRDGKAQQKYVGPGSDDAILKRVKDFQNIKASFQQRREMVRALIAAGLPRPDPITGAIVEALWKAGFFRLRGVLVGTNAYQAYAGLLGWPLSGASLRTQDLDFAQFLAISQDVDDSMPAMGEVLQSVDPTFRPVMDKARGTHVTAFVNDVNYRIEFLTPHRGSGDRIGKPVRMPALGNVSAIQLPFLDFLLREPIRSVLLHGGGVPINVPSYQRFAVHKLIVATRRTGPGRVKSTKDLAQASELIMAISEAGWQGDLIEAWIEAWDRGPQWQAALSRARFALEHDANEALALAADRALGHWEMEFNPVDYNLDSVPK